MNPTIEDWIVWLTDIRAQLVSNFEKVWRYKENVNEHCKSQLNLTSTIDIYDKFVIGSGKIKNKSILMYIML